MSARRRSALRLTSAIAGSAAGASLLVGAALPASAGPSVVTAATGANPWVSQVASPVVPDYAGWLTAIKAAGAARVASPAYAAARTAAGLTAQAPIATPQTGAATALKTFGTATGQNPRATITALTAGSTLPVPTVDGDVLSVSLSGPGSFTIATGAGRLLASPQPGVNLSGLYPASSPLSGAGTSNGVVVDTDKGSPRVTLTGTTAASTLTVEVLRPSGEKSATAARILIDVDGATVDTTKWGGTGVSTLSPLKSFMTKWGLKPNQTAAVVKAMVATVKAGVVKTGRAVNVSTTLGTDTFGQPGVSRVVLGGTTAESGVAAISASTGIDPGNFSREDDSLVQLDTISAAPDTAADRLDDPSLNAYLTADSSSVAFVGHALGQLVLHEIGHQVGLVDADDTDQNRSTMDSATHRIGDNLYLVGLDAVGGTADDFSPSGLLGLAKTQPLEGLSGGFQEPSAIFDAVFTPKPVA